MRFELKPYHRNIQKEELLADIKKVADKLGKDSLSTEEYNKHGEFHTATVIRKIGSWNRAITEVGLKERKRHGITDEELLKNIEKVWMKIGRQPSYSDMQEPLSKYPGRTYLNRFKQWRKALETFIEYVNSENNMYVNNEQHITTKKKQSRCQATPRIASWRLRFLVMRRDNFRCQLCGSVQNVERGIRLDIDHIVPWSAGGATVIENLQTLCNRCNIGKSNLLIKEDH